MTKAAEYRLKGFLANLRVRGRKVKASTGEEVEAIVSQPPLLNEPTDEAKAKTPVYSRVTIEAGRIAKPRDVTEFADKETKKTHRVIEFEESASDTILNKWFCETQPS